MRVSIYFITAFFLHLSLAVVAQERSRILEQRVTYTFREQKSATIEEFSKIRIASEEAYKNCVLINYTDKFRKIESARIDIFDAANNKVKSLRKTDGRLYGYNPSYEINDAKTFVIDPQYKDYPFTAEIYIRIELKGFISLPVWMPRDQFEMPVDRAELAVTYPSTLKVNFREEKVTAEVTHLPEQIITRTYKLSGLEAVAPKIRFQDFYNEQPKVYVTPVTFWLDDEVGSNESWTDFGNWFYQLNNTAYKLEPKTQDFIKRLGTDDTRERVRKIYEYMQDRTRYVSIQLGIGGFKSLPTEEVERYGYGDCKALSTYMKNMLNFAGIKSNYVLTRAGADAPDVVKEFTMNQFNHVYLAVPMSKDTLYLECTSQEAPYDFTGTFTDDRNVLWIEDKKSSIIRSRIYPWNVNIKNTTTEVLLDSLGNAQINLRANNSGIFFDELMMFQGAPASYLQEYHHSKFDYPDFAVKQFKYEHPVRSKADFTSHYQLNVNGLAKVVGGKMVFAPVIANRASHYLDQDNLLGYCSVKRGIQVVDETVVNLPSSFWAYQLPEPQKIESRFGYYELAMEVEGNKLTLKRSFIFYKGDYRKADFEEFKSFYSKIEKLESRKLVLNSKT